MQVFVSGSAVFVQRSDTATQPPTSQRSQRTQEPNQLRHEDRPAHHWYRFILSFPPHLVRHYLQQFQIQPQQQVLDPFCGTGTTLVECKKLGIPSVGVEANPMAHFASCTKLDWQPDPQDLLQHAQHIAETVQATFTATGIPDDLLATLPLAQTPQPDQELRSLSTDRDTLLLKNSISPLPLHKTLVLLEQIQQFHNPHYYHHERLAIAKALVTSISNLHFRPEVCLGRIKPDVPVLASWLSEITTIVNDLHHLKPLATTPAIVHHADSRQLLNVLPPNSIDAVITSPPYPNEKDYTRATRLESVLLGFLETPTDLRSLKHTLVRSNTRNVYAKDDDDRWVAEHPEIQRIAAEIEARRIALGKTSGFERMYARVTRLYFGGMARHLAELRQILRPGAQLAYVVGDQASFLRIMIRTGQLLADIAQALGYEVVRIDLFRTRLATATKEQLREEVVILRWRG